MIIIHIFFSRQVWQPSPLRTLTSPAQWQILITTHGCWVAHLWCVTVWQSWTITAVIWTPWWWAREWAWCATLMAHSITMLMARTRALPVRTFRQVSLAGVLVFCRYLSVSVVSWWSTEDISHWRSCCSSKEAFLCHAFRDVIAGYCRWISVSEFHRYIFKYCINFLRCLQFSLWVFQRQIIITIIIIHLLIVCFQHIFFFSSNSWLQDKSSMKSILSI